MMNKALQKKWIASATYFFNVSLTILFFVTVFPYTAVSQSIDRTLGEQVTQYAEKGAVPLIKNGQPVSLLIGKEEFPGVERVMGYFKNDLKLVAGNETQLFKGEIPQVDAVIIAGTLGKSELIDQLVRSKRINVSALTGKNEMFIIQTVEKPFKGVKKALVITGSDKRGTIYGIFEVSKQMGVSPWNWWADVPVEQYANLYFKKGLLTEGEPKVRYRGIFLNDEEPALGRWAVENFAGFKSGFYEKLFELMLRMKANFIWPAMWWASFNDNDPMNPVLADELGIVMGTSHHEPMNRAHADWRKYGKGAWNYESNPEVLRQFWQEGIEKTKDFETIVTLAMRGDGDEAMSKETNVSLLQNIVSDQREIIAKVTGKKITEVPQVWALYKEVQDYYDEGMRVPDDVTLLLCDDNWGNIRKLPKPGEASRAGGYGIYYHFDYVGGPRNYKWLNTSPIQRVWEQMDLAYRHGVDRIWVVNVGDLKPMEFPIEFFLDMAWDPDRYSPEKLDEYTRKWAENQFGKTYANDIANLLSRYTQFNSRRKPELLTPDTYSHINYGEAQRIADEYNQLVRKSSEIYNKLPDNYRDAYYQLVQYPVEACATVNEMYVLVGQNRLYAKQGRVVANELADRAKKLFDKDSLMSQYYNKTLAGGKWNNMMNQTRIGYTSWQQPPFNVMPKTEIVEPLSGPKMGVAIEGTNEWWPNSTQEAILPAIDMYNRQRYAIDVFNLGNESFTVSVAVDSDLLTTSIKQVNVGQQTRIWIGVKNNAKVSEQIKVPVLLTGSEGTTVTVWAVVDPLVGVDPQVTGFVETNGFIAIEAGSVSRIVPNGEKSWKVMPGFGRTHSGIMPVPSNMHGLESTSNAACIEYDFQCSSAGEASLQLVLAPTLNIYNNQGLRVAVAVNDETPVVLNMHNWQNFRDWEEAVRTNTTVLKSKHTVKQGKNTLKVWALDPAVVLQRILIDSGGLRPSYLGPLESYQIR